MKERICEFNLKKYEFIAVLNYEEKVKKEENLLGIKLGIRVREIESNKILSWSEIKGTYLAEKISDFAKNCFNGQETFYWNYSEDKND